VPVVDTRSLAPHERLPGWIGRSFHSENMTFAYWEIAADAAPLHEHHHLQEEVWNVVEGSLAITIGGMEQVLDAGAAAIIPPDTPHSARAVTACRAIVVDYPLRTDGPASR
jgi:mannose-6-phosphate isomerase-like protein (cupin superfamily)